MNSNPLDGLIAEAERHANYHCFTADHPMRTLLAVVKAAKQLAEGDRAVHDPHGDAYLDAMSTAAEVPHGQ